MYACNYDEESRSALVNLVKDVFVEHLVEEGSLTAEKGEEYIRDYHVEIRKPSWVSKAWGKLWKLENNELVVVILKQMNMHGRT